MNRIKISILVKWPLIRQTPHSSGIWDDCVFSIDQKVDECDWWVVCEGLAEEERVVCSRQNTIFITLEPESIKQYSQIFLDQFGLIITSQRCIRHSNIFYSQQGVPWVVGVADFKNLNEASTLKSYDELKKNNSFNKQKLLSMVVSNKRGTKGHKERLEFAKSAKKYFGDKLDIFGNGFSGTGFAGIAPIPFEDKWDTIAPYKYHIVVENSRFDDYWTEKLTDCYLAGAYPFYYGCPNIGKYFPTESFTEIDVCNFKEAILKIEETIKKNNYGKFKKEIGEARTAILDKYQLFPMICNLIKKYPINKASPEVIILKPEAPLNILSRLWRKVKFIYHRATPV